MLWTTTNSFADDPFQTESELEEAVIKMAPALFGPSRAYLDTKKLIGMRGKVTNIPDGYLIDLTSVRDPKIYVVENELASHEPLKHVAVQILEFSLSFEASPFKVKSILKEAIVANLLARKMCEQYAQRNAFENLDYLLEKMTQGENAFSALVIIDELEAELETALASRFKFPVEILTIERFKSVDGQLAYRFQPFLEDVASPKSAFSSSKTALSNGIDPSDIDTIVVPAQEEGFEEVFISENRWYQIRIHASMISKIKYIAVYQVAPISSITHFAPVKDIALWRDTGKYVVNFAEPAKPIGPIKLVPGGVVKAPQAPRYTSHRKIMAASNMDSAF